MKKFTVQVDTNLPADPRYLEMVATVLDDKLSDLGSCKGAEIKYHGKKVMIQAVCPTMKDAENMSSKVSKSVASTVKTWTGKDPISNVVEET